MPLKIPTISRDGKIFAGGSLCVFLIFILFLPTLNNHFFVLDDSIYVKENEWILKLDWNSFKHWTTQEFAGLWLPFTLFSYAIDHSIWGKIPMGFHFSNILYHAANTLLIYSYLIRRQYQLGLACCVAVIFAIHPVQVESVIWISERKNLLSFLFFLLSCHLWLSFLNSTDKKIPLNFIFVFALSTFSKPMAVFAPILFAVQAKPFWHETSDATSRKSILFALICCIPFSFLSLSLTLYFHAYTDALMLPFAYSPQEHFFTALSLPWYYVKNIFLPTRLSISYLPTTLHALWAPKALFGLSILFLFAFAALKNKRHPQSETLFWIVWIVIFMAPVSTLIAINTWMNDRYLYAPLCAITMLCFRFFPVRIFQNNFFWIVSSCVLIFFLFPITRQQILLWENSETLLHTSLQRHPESLQNKIWSLIPFVNRHDFEGGRGMAEEISKQIPNQPLAVYVRATLLFEQKKYLDANRLVLRALKEHPQDPYLNRTCGNIQMALGDFVTAARFYSRISDTDIAQVSDALLDQIKILLERKNLPLASKIATFTVVRFPNLEESFNLQAVCQYQAGQWAEAMKTLIQGLKLHPDSVTLRKNLLRIAKQITTPEIEFS